MHRIRHMLVCLSGSSADAGLIRYAAGIARLGTTREVRFVRILPARDSGAPDHDRALLGIDALVQEHFRDLRNDIRLCSDVLRGPLEDRLLAYALEQETDLVFVGSDTGTRTLPRRLAMKAPCSVWIVPDGAAPSLRRVLVPVDFSEPSADALAFVGSLKRLAGATQVLALHVHFTEFLAAGDEDPIERGREEDAFRQFQANVPGPAFPVQPLFREGANPARVIARVAEEEAVDLIAMSTRGRSRSTAVLLGSVTEETIRGASRPLLVVKHFGAKLGLIQALLHGVQQRGPGIHYN